MFDSIYLVTITLTTVGYGDISPKTPTGRIICMALGIWGAVIISLIVTTVSNVFTLTENQSKAVRHIQMTQRATNMIGSAYKLYLTKKKYYLLKVQDDNSLYDTNKFVNFQKKFGTDEYKKQLNEARFKSQQNQLTTLYNRQMIKFKQEEIEGMKRDLEQRVEEFKLESMELKSLNESYQAEIIRNG